MRVKCDTCGDVFEESVHNFVGMTCTRKDCGGTLHLIHSLLKCTKCGNAYGSPPLNCGDLCQAPLEGSTKGSVYAKCLGTLRYTPA
ncbi:MAG: hypothetical protein HZB61_09300 [Nitrospirae bacterium]|nr:hypothetical protein [Nitrospirota bacterium]